uniref:Uncharacterized protein n=1 Tax=Compsopogon caeruleus TaxID=31354 RepID=A0A7S1TIU6_9RHOD
MAGVGAEFGVATDLVVVSRLLFFFFFFFFFGYLFPPFMALGLRVRESSTKMLDSGKGIRMLVRFKHPDFSRRTPKKKKFCGSPLRVDCNHDVALRSRVCPGRSNAGWK